MHTLSIDIEDFSKTPIDHGMYKRHADPSFEILIICLKRDDGPIERFSLATGDKMPSWFIPALTDQKIIKRAFNAAYEISGLSTHFKIKLDPSQWRCTMVLSASLGLPMSLDGVGAALNLKDQKDRRGKALITFFCIPCEPTAANNFRIRNLPHHDLTKWREFVNYCERDVLVEVNTYKKLSVFPEDKREQRLWELDRKINDRGFLMDKQLIQNALSIYNNHKSKLLKEASALTGLANANSLPQLKAWLGDPTMKLDKDVVKTLLKTTDDVKVMRVLEIRQETGKSSVDKYVSMLHSMTSDNIVRGAIQHYGAGTGRSAGRLFQPHNLPKNEEHFDLDFAHYLVKTHNAIALEKWFGSVIYPLSQLCRTAIIPDKDFVLAASDFSQIESRAAAAIAGERWKLEAFKRGEDLYITGASKMFGIPREAIRKDSDERQQGKVAELACGYQGASSAIIRSWPKHLPLPTEEAAQGISDLWRAANPMIVDYWKEINKAALLAVEHGVRASFKGCTFFVYKGILFCELPNGRKLAYPRPRMGKNQWGWDCVICHGINPNTRQWLEINIYGGLLTENIIQAICRDILFDKMVVLDAAGFDIRGHVHDEVIVQCKPYQLEQITDIMIEPLAWFPNIPLAAVTKGLEYYKKA